MARRQVLVERFLSRPKSVEFLDEAKRAETGRLLHFSGVKVGEARKINRNNRRYGMPIYTREVEKLDAGLREGPKPGADGHPGLFDKIGWSDQAVGFTHVYMHGRDALADGFVVDTSKGRDVAACMRAGFAIGASSRATGTVTERTMGPDDPDYEVNAGRDGDKFDDVNDDFCLHTFDVVVDPGVEDAQIRAFRESLERGEEDEMPPSDDKATAALRAENEQLKADAAKAKAEAEKALEAKASELTKAFAEDRAKLEAQLPTKEQRALLDRAAKLDAAKLEHALQVAEGKVGGAPDDVGVKLAALEAKNLALAGEVEALRKSQVEVEAKRAQDAKDAALEAHISRLAGKNESLRALLKGRAKTPEECDALVEEVKKAAGVGDLGGLAPGEPKGAATLSDGQYQPSDASSDGTVDESIRNGVLRLVGGGGKRAAAAGDKK